QRERLADPQAGTRQHRKQDTPGRPLYLGRLEQSRQLFGLDPWAVRACRLQPPPFAARRVRGDQLILNGGLEHLRQVRQRVVDRVVRQAAFADLLATRASLLELV